MPRRTRLLQRSAAVLAIPVLAIPLLALSLAGQEPDDPFLWLEEVEGEQALAWVHERNAESREELGSLPHYESLYDGTLEILTSSDRTASRRSGAR